MNPEEILDAAFLTDPYPFFAALRRHDPVHWNAPTGAWYVTRYADVFDLLVDPRLSASAEGETLTRTPAERDIAARVHDFFGRWMVFSDPPHQTRVRETLRHVFTPSSVASFQSEVDRISTDTVTAFRAAGRDLMTDLTIPFARATVSVLLGVEPEEFAEVARWSEELMAFLNRSAHEPHDVRSTLRAVQDLTDYVCTTVLPRGHGLAAPALRSAVRDGGWDPVTTSATFAQLLTGALEPVSNGLGVTVTALQRHPDQRRAVSEGQVSYADAVEEALRFDAPFHLAARRALADITVGGVTIHRGDRVMLVLASANRDEDRFAAPDRFDVRRGPARHLSFGRGGHYCLGSFLARQEMAVLLRELDRQWPELQVNLARTGRSPAFGATQLRPVPILV
ncbi:cytochrome P450 [Streptomyces filipinensis]|uniref:Cytochrome P450 n=1 Tax=Streptomyces filipinensis TaxID=66887 RepID=A0A918I838_9ACTN|nr:cytochrome P450 [Streptomyces filipinensis]GGU86088.1 cytochrome P450 [Streptomyces filipinensis]